MASLTFTDELTSPVAAARMFKGLILDADTLLPKLIPQAIKSIETIQGNGGPGTVKQINILEGSEVKHIKHRIDVLDKEKMTYSYTVIEGGDVGDKLESISYEIKFEDAPNGGSKCTSTSKYNLKPGAHVEDEEIKAVKEKATALFKAVEAYLLANPNA